MWDHLPREVQQQLVDKGIDLWVIDAYRGRRRGRHGQPHQHRHAALLLPARRRAARRRGHRAASRRSVEETYGRRGRAVVERNFAAIDRPLTRARTASSVPAAVDEHRALGADGPRRRAGLRRSGSRRVLMAGDGDLLPVSALPVDGTFPTGTAAYEKRAIAKEIPIWDPDICIDCGKCAIVCPHATIRMKVFAPEAVADAPARVPAARRSARRTSPATA